MRRRGFIKNAGIALGGSIALPLVGRSSLKFGSEVVRVGVIGTGDRGTGLMRLIDEIDGMQVTACCDIIPFRRNAAVELGNSVTGFEDYKELLREADVDAVIVATPFSTHDEIAIDALDAGKHVFCEKTMAKGLDRTQKVVDKTNSTDLVFQTGHQWHSSPLYQKAREIIRNGYLGEITSFECQWNRNGDWRRPVPDPKWERMINWRMYREYSGGLVAELMSHQIDWINWVKESHPEKIVGFGGIDHWDDGRETFDNAHVMFQYPDGVEATFTCTTTNGFGDFGIKVLGSKATMMLDYTTGEIYAERSTIVEKGLVDGVSGATIKAWEEGKPVRIEAPGNDPTIDALREFYRSITQGAAVTSGVGTGATTSKCVHIALEALHYGGVREWKDYPELKNI